MTKDHLASIRANVCNMNDAPQVGTCAVADRLI